MYVRQRPNNMPVFKYTRGLGGEVGKDIATYLPTLTSIDSYRSETFRKSMPATRRRFEGSLSIKGLANACAPKSPFAFIPCLSEEEMDVDDLEEGSVERFALSEVRPHLRLLALWKVGSPPTFTNSPGNGIRT